MNIPLDNLYHWIRGLANEPVSIYTFSPHGSKNITDLNFHSTVDHSSVFPEVVCHDQEPLNFDQYQSVNAVELWAHVKRSRPNQIDVTNALKELAPRYQDLNFFAMLRVLNHKSIFDRYILLHSEQNSKDVEQFSAAAEPVYYWSHAVIARDWYRFAETDVRLTQPSANKKTFLVYCRAWTGTREYRLKFLELLIDYHLIPHCNTSILHQDQGQDLAQYQCNDSRFQPANIKKLMSMPQNYQPATSSADYSAQDIVNSDISIVLETVAADTKVHLTEKTLRPIACGHPFMLVAGPRALEYLRSYGFKTFSEYIDESYDCEPDIIKRMSMIAKEMARIQNLPLIEKNQLLQNLQNIAEYNKRHFFSNSFSTQIKTELIDNLNQAIAKVKNTQGRQYFATRKAIKKYHGRNTTDPIDRLRRVEVAKILRQLRQDPLTNIKTLVDQHPPDFFNY
jgi:hypothetical protein